jgi:hypothetical protein
MALLVTIDGITGTSPYDIYICTSGGTDCLYIDTTSTIPYEFYIPTPFAGLESYMVKVIDDLDCTITGTTVV